MNKFTTAFFAAAPLLLVGCGGGDDALSAVGLNARPVMPQEAASEQGAGFFTAFFAQSKLADGLVASGTARPFENGKAEVKSGTVKVYLDENNDEVLYIETVRDDGTIDRLNYKEVASAAGANGLVSYDYDRDDGQVGELDIHRRSQGVVWGRLYDGESATFNNSTALNWEARGNFLYGWPVDVSVFPPTGTVRFEHPGGADLFLSDGRRLFGGDVDLTADFGSRKISGTLFKGSPDPQFQELAAEVTLTEGQINADGSIAAADKIIFTQFDDLSTTNPYTTVTINSSTVDGQFIGGTDTQEVIGNYGGSTTTTRVDGLQETVGFAGIFRGVQ